MVIRLNALPLILTKRTSFTGCSIISVIKRTLSKEKSLRRSPILASVTFPLPNNPPPLSAFARDLALGSAFPIREDAVNHVNVVNAASLSNLGDDASPTSCMTDGRSSSRYSSRMPSWWNLKPGARCLTLPCEWTARRAPLCVDFSVAMVFEVERWCRNPTMMGKTFQEGKCCRKCWNLGSLSKKQPTLTSHDRWLAAMTPKNEIRGSESTRPNTNMLHFQ